MAKHEQWDYELDPRRRFRREEEPVASTAVPTADADAPVAVAAPPRPASESVDRDDLLSPEYWGAERPAASLDQTSGRRYLALAAVSVPVLVVLALKIMRMVQADQFLLIYGVLVTATITFALVRRILAYKDPALEPPASGATRTPRVTALVAAFNEQEHIERCVRSMVASDYSRLEVIVVDDASTDGTPQVLKRLEDELGITALLLKENLGKKGALAEATRLATGEILVYTDSDSMLASDAISLVVDAFASDPEIGAVSGHARILNPKVSRLARVQDAWYETQFSVWKAAESSYGAVTCVSGPLAAFRREAIFSYMPAWVDDEFLGRKFRFATDRQLTGYVLGGEQIGQTLQDRYADDWFVQSERHRPRAWKVVYSRAAHVWTDAPARFASVVKQQIRWKKSFIRNLFFTGKFYWRRPRGAAFLFYGGALYTVLGPIIAARQLLYLPSQGHYLSGVVYLSGILFVGVMFALFIKAENPDSRRWFLRPLMSLMSTLALSWLLLYSIATLRRMTWARGGTQ